MSLPIAELLDKHFARGGMPEALRQALIALADDWPFDAYNNSAMSRRALALAAARIALATKVSQ